MARRTTVTTTLQTLSPRLPAETRAAAVLLTEWLDRGMITPNEAHANMARLAHHDGAMADVLTHVLQAWHAAELAQVHTMLARGI